MMSFNEFVHAFTDGFKDYLPPDYHDAEIWAERVVKTNDQILTGINIRRSGDLVSPRIYVDGMYEDYIHGKSMEEVFCDARDTWSWALKQAPERDVVQNILNDLEKAKGMISYRLINRKANEEYLAERPWTPIADLACVYQAVHRPMEIRSIIVIVVLLTKSYNSLYCVIAPKAQFHAFQP